MEACSSSVHQDNVTRQNEASLLAAFHCKAIFLGGEKYLNEFAWWSPGHKFILLSENSVILYSAVLPYAAAV